jgi:hypothetical protein
VYGTLGRSIALREPPYHLWEFRPGSLTKVLRASRFEVVSLRQTKIPPGRPHGRKGLLQAAVMTAIDAINLPLTTVFNARGDRVQLVARAV